MTGASGAAQIAKSEEIKAQANKKFQANHLNEAIELYSQAIENNPTNHILFANRAFCHIKLENYGNTPPSASSQRLALLCYLMAPERMPSQLLVRRRRYEIGARACAGRALCMHERKYV